MALPLIENFEVTTAKPIEKNMQVADITARNNIPVNQRYLGMVTYVVSESKFYTLKTGTANIDWEEFGVGGGSSGWGLTGNDETDPSINFIGTIDNVDFVTKTNNIINFIAKKEGGIEISEINNDIVLGEELLLSTLNGNADGWILGLDAVYNNNSIEVLYTDTNADPIVSTTFESEENKEYQITFTISNASALVQLFLDNNTNYISESYAEGTHTISFLSNFTGTDTLLFEHNSYENNTGYTISNVSIKEYRKLPSLKNNGSTCLKENEYINFNDIVGENGYGIRDNNGVIEYKNINDFWNPISYGWSLNGNNINPNNKFGTLNNQDLVFIRNNTEAGRIGLNNIIFTNSPANIVSSHNIVLLGNRAGESIISSAGSIFIGNFSGRNAFSSPNSIFIGNQAGEETNNSSNSILIGTSSGKRFIGNNIGNNNIIIGTNISLPNATENAINIGGVLFGINTYANISGNPSITPTPNGRIGIGVVTPTAVLHLRANITQEALLRLTVGPAPIFPNDGDIWLESNTITGLKMRIGGVTRTITMT